MPYKHGIYITEEPTALTPMTRVTSPVVAIGTASKGVELEPVICQTFSDYVAAFGYVGGNVYSLDEVAYCFFNLFNVAPVIFINVGELIESRQVEDVAINTDIALSGRLVNGVVVKSGTKTLVEGEDYTLKAKALTLLKLDNVTGGKLQLKITSHSSATAKAKLLAGIEKVERVYPKLGMVPGVLIAPGFSYLPEVATALGAKAHDINGCFKAHAVCDVMLKSSTNDAEVGLTDYQEVNEAKTTHYPADEFISYCWPQVQLGAQKFWLSTQVAAQMMLVDAGNDDIPFESPSNKFLRVDSSFAQDTPIFLSKAEATTLNAQGIVTALNFAGMWRLWGSRTGCYPAVDDPKDAFVSCRRMMSWFGNTLAINYLSRIDSPLNKRLVESVLDEVQVFINGLTARGVLLGGRIAFFEEENPKTALTDGLMTFHVYLGLVTPARAIEFVLEYDTNYLATLFA